MNPAKIKVVEVKDGMVEIDAFKTMILFCNSAFKNINLTGDLALPVLYIGIKYMIKPLEVFCVDFLLEHLDRDKDGDGSMFFTIFQFCVDCSVDKRLMEKCITILRTDWDYLMQLTWREDREVEESFLKISQKCLIHFLDVDFPDAQEIDLFDLALAWSKAACDGDSTNGEALRSKLGNALKLIRFPLMSLKDFVKSVVPTGILTVEEQRDILLIIAGESPIGTPICVSILPRSGELNIDSSLTGRPYQIATKTNVPTNKTQLQTILRIDDFRSFVDSKENYETKAGTYFEDVDWFIVIDLSKYCQKSERYITLNSTSSDTPEFLGIHFYCEGNLDAPDPRYFYFDAIIKFKRASFSKKFFLFMSDQEERGQYAHPKLHCLSSPDRSSESNLYKKGFGAKIEDILNEHNGYLTGNSLEMNIQLSISPRGCNY